MSDKMREEFEAAYMRDLVGSSAEDASLWLERGSDGDYRSFQARGAWWGFKVSRESLVIELPEKDPSGSGGGDCGDGRPSEEQYVAAHCNIVLAQCRAAIEAAGLKVKS